MNGYTSMYCQLTSSLLWSIHVSLCSHRPICVDTRHAPDTVAPQCHSCRSPTVAIDSEHAPTTLPMHPSPTTQRYRGAPIRPAHWPPLPPVRPPRTERTHCARCVAHASRRSALARVCSARACRNMVRATQRRDADARRTLCAHCDPGRLRREFG